MTVLRKSGIDVLGDVPWGSHFCNFYETKQDLLDTLVPYFKAGLENKEFCMWVVSNPDVLTLEEAKAALEQAIPDIARHISEKNIEIISAFDVYLIDNVFDMERVSKKWDEKLRQALVLGYDGIRISGDAGWLEGEKDWMDFSLYENQVNDSVTGMPITILCTYPLSKIGAAEILDVVQTHQFAVARRYGEWEVFKTPEIIKAKKELERVNGELEQRVVERTKQLADAIEDLKFEIAERKKAEVELQEINKELRSLSSHLQNIREEERIQVARDIHDDLGQQLTGLKMDVNWLCKKLATQDETVKQKLDSMIDLIDDTLKSVRRISTDLRPGILDDFGLIAALEWHSEEVSKRSETKVWFDTDVIEPNLPVPMASAIFRIYQELLNNVVRHANAHIITSCLRLESNGLILQIKDDGKGMDVAMITSKKTLGLIGIKERIFALGGKCNLESEPGKGTEVQVYIPYQPG